MPPMPNPTCYCAVCQGRKSHSLLDYPACGDCGNDGCRDCGGAGTPALVDTSKPLYGHSEQFDRRSYSLGFEDGRRQGHANAVEEFFVKCLLPAGHISEAEAKAVLRAVAQWTMCLRPASHTSADYWVRCNGGMTGECTPDIPLPSGVGDPHGKCGAPNWNLPDGGCDKCGAVHCPKCVADTFGDLPDDALPMLRIALAGISVPEQFTTAGPAVTADGVVVRVNDKDAVAWSITGILYKALGRATEDLLFRQQPKGFRCAVEALLAAMPDGYQSIGQYARHPDTGHADAVALYDRAIALLETQSE